MRRTVLALVLSCLWGIAVFAQDSESQNQLFLIHEDVVKPSKIGEYEAASKELMAAFKEHGMSVPEVHVAMTDDLHYLHVVPVENLAHIDNMQNAWGELAKKVGEEKMKSIEEGFAGTYEYHKDFMARRHNDLSYQPETPRIKPEETGFLHWDFFYLQSGKQEEAEQIAKEYLAMHTSNNIPDGYNVYFGEMGTDMPLLVVVRSAKSAIDYYTHAEKYEKMMGDALKKLEARAMSISRKFEHKNGMPRPDLSYMPAEEADMTQK